MVSMWFSWDEYVTYIWNAHFCSDIKGYKKHILTTVNDQIPHVIAKGGYYKHSMVVWSEFWVKVYY